MSAKVSVEKTNKFRVLFTGVFLAKFCERVHVCVGVCVCVTQ